MDVPSDRLNRRRGLGVAACAVLLLTSACARTPVAAQQVPVPDRGELLGPARVAALPEAERRAWTLYLEESRRLRDLDRTALDAELRALGEAKPTRAPTGPSGVLTDEMTAEWFRSDDARRMADIVLSFQTPSGGWSKRLDLRSRPRRPGESHASENGYVGTFDNYATTDQIRFLIEAYRAHGDERYRQAFLRGLGYVSRAQFPNGCWPQVYPLQGGYHDAVTYNDDVIARILRLLRDVQRQPDGGVPEAVRRQAARSMRQGVECVLASQVVVDGRRTVWGAQHDPLTLVPVRARAYEHASLSGGESADLMEFLMGLESPDRRVVEAVHAAARWFHETAIRGFEYEPKGGLVAKEGAGPIWARFYEIGTNRPIFSNRDGRVLYRWDELEDERRHGYAWFRAGPAKVLKKYEEWARRHPAGR